MSRKIRELVDVPIFLAGGLNPENVREAIRQVGPFGVDVCSGVRTGGKLDEDRLREFFVQINRRRNNGVLENKYSPNASFVETPRFL